MNIEFKVDNPRILISNLSDSIDLLKQANVHEEDNPRLDKAINWTSYFLSQLHAHILDAITPEQETGAILHADKEGRIDTITAPDMESFYEMKSKYVNHYNNDVIPAVCTDGNTVLAKDPVKETNGNIK